VTVGLFDLRFAMADEFQEILTLKELEQFTTLKRDGIMAALRRGEFPAPVWLSRRQRVWLKADIIKWQRERIAVTRGKSRKVVKAKL
jgi:prophage regulatory protein